MKPENIEWSFHVQARKTHAMRHALWLFVIRKNIKVEL